MLKINEKNLVKIAVQGKVSNPVLSPKPAVDAEGKSFSLPSIGGITYNVFVGDSVYDWEGDHIEPGVSAIADEKNRTGGVNSGFNFYSCIGNEAVIVSATDKKIVGKKGTVIGHHGGAEHVVIDFPASVLDKMTYKDDILVKGFGQGLKLIDYPDVHIFNLDPGLLKKMNIKEKKGKLEIGVSAIVPGELMGSGVGALSVTTGDYDMMTMDKEYLKKHKLMNLRFGDFVAIKDHDNRYGRCFREGAYTIGIVMHSDCKFSGHGPGIATLMSDISGTIVPVIDKDANIGKVMKIGKFKK